MSRQKEKERKREKQRNREIDQRERERERPERERYICVLYAIYVFLYRSIGFSLVYAHECVGVYLVSSDLPASLLGLPSTERVTQQRFAWGPRVTTVRYKPQQVSGHPSSEETRGSKNKEAWEDLLFPLYYVWPLTLGVHVLVRRLKLLRRSPPAWMWCIRHPRNAYTWRASTITGKSGIPNATSRNHRMQR